ncbi:MAG: HAMP domain-containing histidine kinase [Lachnospiraceae bacterium]|nr:HAMP domain-containing histidine kinase [Lachnospiraceae bacterium]
MKLSTKTILASLALVLIPVLLLALSLLWLSVYRPRTLSSNAGEQEELNIMNINAIRRFDRLMTQLEQELDSVYKRGEDALLNPEALSRINQRISYQDDAYLLAWNNGWYYNGGDDNEELMTFVEDADMIGKRDMVYFAGLSAPDLIGCQEFTASDGSIGAVFLVCDVSGALPSLQRIIALIAFSVFALIAGFFVLAFWSQSQLVKPVKELKLAANAIREGNLDYELKTEASDEFGELCRDFEEMRLRLKSTAEEQIQYEQNHRVLIRNISHDLKTPITAIKGYVEGIQDGVASSPAMLEKYLRTIYKKADDMDKLVDELSFYSKVNMSRIPYNFAKISVTDYFEDCVDELSPELEAQQIGLTYRNEMAKDAMIIGDPEQLHRVINNIISNAVKYMDKAEKHIAIRVKDAGDFVRIEVEDNGRGIAAQDLPYIFDRFYRTDQSRNSRTGGSGIGLSIVKKVIEDHGGRVWAVSRLGEGTTMNLELRKYEEET